MDEPSFRVSQYTFRSLGKQNNMYKNFQFVIKEQFKHMFHLQTGSVLSIKNSEYENILSDEKEILQRLEKNKYDLIIDLNAKFHLGIARLVSLLKADLKVGFFTPFSDPFYNIQLDISKSGIMEKGFKQVNMMLDS